MYKCCFNRYIHPQLEGWRIIFLFPLYQLNYCRNCLQFRNKVHADIETDSEESFTFKLTPYFWHKWTLKIPLLTLHSPLPPCSSRHEILLSLSFTTLQTTILSSELLSFSCRLWDTLSIKMVLTYNYDNSRPGKGESVLYRVCRY